MPGTSYDRPVKATLLVRLENGEEWEATEQDLAKFGLLNRNDAYTAIRKRLAQIFVDHNLLDNDERRDLTDTEINPLRYLIETALCYPDLLDHPEHEGWAAVADLERRLRTTQPQPASD